MDSVLSMEAMNLEDNSTPSIQNVNATDLYPKRGLQKIMDDNSLENGGIIEEPFPPIFGESIEYMTRCSNDDIIALSNYRLYLRREDCTYNVPVVCIDSVEVKEIVNLHILCKDIQILKCTFTSGDVCVEWQKRIVETCCPPKDLDKAFALAFYAWANDEADEDARFKLGQNIGYELAMHTQSVLPVPGSIEASESTFIKEIERLEFDIQGPWRVSKLNMDYGLCPSYPKLLLIPACISDESLEAVARFRGAKRVPAVVWRHRGNGAVLARCSQPEVGWLGWRSNEDEDLIRAIADACAFDSGINIDDSQNSNDSDLADEPQKQNNSRNVLIVDARSYATAVANRARGGGVECAEYYPRCDISFMNLINIHAVRRSAQNLRTILADSPDQSTYFTQMEQCKWFQYMSGLIRSALAVAAAIEREARPVLIHCSDGWDRTPQIAALSQLLLDPYYRTIEGFQVLLEREWLDFGHKFADRCGLGAGATDDGNERSPVFLQFLDCVHQLLNQFPCAFQFSQAYLARLAQHVYSNLFGTFLCNSQQERERYRVAYRTLSVWKFLAANPSSVNLLYAPYDEVLWPSYRVRDFKVWSEVYLRSNNDILKPVPAPPPDPPREDSNSSYPVSSSSSTPPVTENGISKTRSCENLSSTPTSCHVRRSSHPSLTESNIDSLLNEIENISLDVNGDNEEDDSEQILSASPVPPVVTSVESSTDTLVPTTTSATSAATATTTTTTTIETATITTINNHNHHNHHQQPQPHCNVCANSRRFLLESNVANSKRFLLESHMSEFCNNNHVNRATSTTSNSYPPTPGSDCCVNTEENCVGVRCLPIMTSSQQRQLYHDGPKLEIDGLSSSHSDVQTRVFQIIADYKSQMEALHRELHNTRLALIQQVCHHCGPPNSNGDYRADDTGSIPESVDSLIGAGSNSRPSSDVSWEKVDEKDTQPILWVPDHAAHRCMGCDSSFSIGRRRHHCRSCGKVFCADCSGYAVPLPAEQFYEPVRVCASCYHKITPQSPCFVNNIQPNNNTVPNSQQPCKQPSPHEKIHKPIVSTGST